MQRYENGCAVVVIRIFGSGILDQLPYQQEIRQKGYLKESILPATQA